MARIRIEDLPTQEIVSAEEAKEQHGAGRARLGLEALETRELLAAGLSAALPAKAPDAVASVYAGSGGTVYAIDLQGSLFRHSDTTGWQEVSDASHGRVTAVATSHDAAAADSAFAQLSDTSLESIGATGATAITGHLKTVQSGQKELFGLDSKGELWVFDATAKRWTDTGKAGKDFSVGKDGAGKDIIYLQVSDNTIWLRSAQGKWASTGGKLTSMQAGLSDLYGLDSKGQLWLYSPAGGWKNTGQSGKAFVIGKLYTTAYDQVFLQKADNSIWVYDGGKWTDTGGHLHAIQAAKGQVFGLDSNNKLWSFDAATKKWQDTGKSGVSFVLGTDAKGGNEAYLMDGGGNLFEYDGGSWMRLTPPATHRVGHGAAGGDVAVQPDTGTGWYDQTDGDGTADTITTTRYYWDADAGQLYNSNDDTWYSGTWSLDSDGQTWDFSTTVAVRSAATGDVIGYHDVTWHGLAAEQDTGS